MNVVKMPQLTRDEILDDYLVAMQDIEDRSIMDQYEYAKYLKRAHDMFALDVGRPRKTNISKEIIKYASFTEFCKAANKSQGAATNAVKVVEMLGMDANLSQVKLSFTSLRELAYQSDEIKEEFLPKILDGEKVKIKEVLKSLTKPQREIVAEAGYELDEEERTGMTIEEIQADHERADDFIANDLPRIKQEAKDNRKATYQEGLEKLDDYVDETKEVQEWLFAIIKQIPLDKQPAVSKKALYSTFNICYDGACAETDVVNFIETNINTY